MLATKTKEVSASIEKQARDILTKHPDLEKIIIVDAGTMTRHKDSLFLLSGEEKTLVIITPATIACLESIADDLSHHWSRLKVLNEIDSQKPKNIKINLGLINDLRLKNASLYEAMEIDEQTLFAVRELGNEAFWDIYIKPERERMALMYEDIIQTAEIWKKAVAENNGHREKRVIIATTNINLAMEATRHKIWAETCIQEKDNYTGMADIHIHNSEAASVRRLYSERVVDAKLFKKSIYQSLGRELFSNECCFFWVEGKNQPTLAIYKKTTNTFVYVPEPNKGSKVNYPLQGQRLCPPNHRLAFLYALASDISVKKLFVNGIYGSAKTTAIADVMLSMIPGAFSSGKKQCAYSKGMYMRRPLAMRGQKDMGAYPGNKWQKTRDWYKPFFDAMGHIFHDNIQQMNNKRTDNEPVRSNGQKPEIINVEGFVLGNFVSQDLIQLEPIDDKSGRSISGTLIFIDEAQDLNPEQFLLLSTRAQADSKIVMAGEIKISNDVNLSATNNGLAVAFQYTHELGNDKIAFVTLTESLRNPEDEKYIEDYRRGIV